MVTKIPQQLLFKRRISIDINEMATLKVTYPIALFLISHKIHLSLYRRVQN